MGKVRFLQGTQEDYEALGDWDSGTFYYTGTNLYLGQILLSDSGDMSEILVRLSNDEDAIETLKDSLGNLENLGTTSKNDLVSAINEVLAAIGAGGTDAVVAIQESSSEDYAKVYTITQGGVYIGTINIPKDLVVESGTVEVDPEGKDPGTYIVLTLANSDNTQIYIDVADLVNIYTVEEDAVQIQLKIVGTELSASVVAGSIGTIELSDDAVTTAKIADGNVTTEKLSVSLQEAIEKASNSIQTITTGTTNGTIAVDGVDIAVAGLGTAAYASATEFDEAGAADQALTDAKEYADDLLSWKEY